MFEIITKATEAGPTSDLETEKARRHILGGGPITLPIANLFTKIILSMSK